MRGVQRHVQRHEFVRDYGEAEGDVKESECARAADRVYCREIESHSAAHDRAHIQRA